MTSKDTKEKLDRIMEKLECINVRLKVLEEKNPIINVSPHSTQPLSYPPIVFPIQYIMTP